LNEISDLFAFVESPRPSHGFDTECLRAERPIRKSTPASSRETASAMSPYLDLSGTLREREDAARELLRVEHARVLFGARIVFVAKASS
jgi:hypothetical protein